MRRPLAAAALVATLAACGSAAPTGPNYSSFPFTVPPAGYTTAPAATEKPWITTDPNKDPFGNPISTVEPAPTNNTVETAQPIPTLDMPFSDIKLTGRGAKVVKFTIPTGAAIVRISEKGTSNFVVESLDSHGQSNDLLVNEIGNYGGTVLLDAADGQHSVAFKIDSNGSWTLIIRPLLAARAWDPSGPLAGKGDDVVIVFPEPSDLTIVTLKHLGESNFAIWAYGTSGGDLIVNEIGHYSGETTLADGTGLLQVTADGAWSVTPQ